MALKRTSKHGSGKSSAQQYEDYARTYADLVIQKLEEGSAPWIRPWKAGVYEPGMGMPYNAVSGVGYSGSNVGWLLMVKELKGYSDDRWLTFKQAMDLGCNVRKGEQSTQCVKWLRYMDKDKERVEGDEREQRGRMFPKLFPLFNADQVEGMPKAPERKVPKEHERHEQCEALVQASGAIVMLNGGNQAYYNPRSDSIHLPSRDAFKSTDNYYATLLHELGHWTGHKSRLDRDLSGKFGSAAYGREELRAEMASMMIGDRLAIGHDPGQHVAYIASWISLLKEHPREILLAASDAESICNHLGVAKYEHEPMKTKVVEQEREERAREPKSRVPERKQDRGLEMVM